MGQASGCSRTCTLSGSDGRRHASGTKMPTDHGDVQVLIVDDQVAYRRAARSVVELTPGFVVAGEAETGEAAVVSARGERPDLVLMDVHLPGIRRTGGLHVVITDIRMPPTGTDEGIRVAERLRTTHPEIG